MCLALGLPSNAKAETAFSVENTLRGLGRQVIMHLRHELWGLPWSARTESTPDESDTLPLWRQYHFSSCLIREQYQHGDLTTLAHRLVKFRQCVHTIDVPNLQTWSWGGYEVLRIVQSLLVPIRAAVVGKPVGTEFLLASASLDLGKWLPGVAIDVTSAELQITLALAWSYERQMQQLVITWLVAVDVPEEIVAHLRLMVYQGLSPLEVVELRGTYEGADCVAAPNASVR